MNKTTFFLLCALAASLVVGTILFREWKSTLQEYNNLSGRYQAALNQEPITIIKEVIDTARNTSTTVYAPSQVSGEVQNYVSKEQADRMAEALNVAAKKIDRLESLLITMKGEGKGERHIDTTTKNEWLVLKNDPSFDVKVNLSNDSIYPGVRLRLMQAYAPYRKNIFSRTEYRSAITVDDHRARISEIIDVNKVPRSPRWSIGVFGGPLVSQHGFSYGAGLGLTYDLIQF